MVIVEEILEKEFIVCNIHSNEWPISDYKPIPLTEEWLLKFGFILEKDLVWLREDEKEYQVYRKNISIIDIKGSYYLWIGIEEDDWYSFEWTKIEYVHQLQNLFFALTNTELEIK